MPTAEVNGTRLHYERSGAGEPLVLIHGSWVDCRAWDRVVPVLGRSFEVVVYDRRGHSRSSGPSGQGSIHEDVDDLAGLIELLELAPAHVSGSSFGGSIALRLSAAHPELMRSVAAHEPPLFDLLEDGDAGWPELLELRTHLAAVAALLEAGDDEGGARHYVDRVSGTPGDWAALDSRSRRVLAGNAHTYLDQYRDPAAMDIELEDLNAFGGPVLVTHGDRRPPLFRRIVEIVAAAIPGAQTELIPGTAHDPQLTHPGAYARALQDFAAAPAPALSRVESRRP
jgi:pimeloyl-ACP methyl ester carboxylesterase